MFSLNSIVLADSVLNETIAKVKKENISYKLITSKSDLDLIKDLSLWQHLND